MAERARGFTLIEILVALTILVLAVTSALGVFSRGAAMERSAELVHDASRLARIVQDRVLHGDWLGRAGEELPNDLHDLRMPGFPGMLYDVAFRNDPERPEEVLVVVAVRWLRAGREVAERFRFFAVRGRPLAQRIQEKRQGGNE